MLLAETEIPAPAETVIRPFRDVLIGLFFITIGTLLDLQLLFGRLWLVLLLVVGLQLAKMIIVTVVARLATDNIAQGAARRCRHGAGRRVRLRAAHADAERHGSPHRTSFSRCSPRRS
jgi:Kef-type K+ transport system membrane component KefB